MVKVTASAAWIMSCKTVSRGKPECAAALTQEAKYRSSQRAECRPNQRLAEVTLPTVALLCVAVHVFLRAQYRCAEHQCSAKTLTKFSVLEDKDDAAAEASLSVELLSSCWLSRLCAALQGCCWLEELAFACIGCVSAL